MRIHHWPGGSNGYHKVQHFVIMTSEDVGSSFGTLPDDKSTDSFHAGSAALNNQGVRCATVAAVNVKLYKV